MLANFKVYRNFYGLYASVSVDMTAGNADFMASYNGIIKIRESVPFRDVDNVQKAESWLIRHVPVKDGVTSFIEYLEERYRTEGKSPA